MGHKKDSNKFEDSIPSTVTLLDLQNITTTHSPGLWQSEKSLSSIPERRSILKTILNVSGHEGVCGRLIAILRMKTEDNKI